MKTAKSAYKLPQLGVSLIELMIGIVISLIILAGVTNIWLTTIMSSSDTLKQSKLNQELTTLMSVMSRDINRAGITGTLDYTNPQTNAFNQPDNTALEVIDNMTNNSQVTFANSATGGSCVVYAYDRDLDGVVDIAEVVGFRLNNGAVEMRRNVIGTNSDSCATADGSWLPVTDNRIITITDLNFAFNNSECINTREPNGVDDDGDVSTDDTAEMDCYTVVPTNGSGDVTVETRQID
ncbi:MAG: prepilin-type N-terminal cleavage/methylation domain-containing protein, partial [Gammaproteobacteria bacterium]